MDIPKVTCKWFVNFFWIGEKSPFNIDFITKCNDDSDEGCLLEVDLLYIENLHKLHNNLLFLPGRMKIEKIENITSNLQEL